jgi:2-oxoisovalerate dehydrogenase E2 component (dihydrolipoyl transacylase)
VGQYIIKMPDIGEGIAEVELVHWYVKPGDVVAEEQTLADVMDRQGERGDSRAPSRGKVISITGKPGDVIAVGTRSSGGGRGKGIRRIVGLPAPTGRPRSVAGLQHAPPPACPTPLLHPWPSCRRALNRPGCHDRPLAAPPSAVARAS